MGKNKGAIMERVICLRHPIRFTVCIVAAAALGQLSGCGAAKYDISVSLDDSIYDDGEVESLHTVYFIATDTNLEDRVQRDLQGERSFFDPGSPLRKEADNAAADNAPDHQGQHSQVYRKIFTQGSEQRVFTLEASNDIWERWSGQNKLLVVAVPPVGRESNHTWHEVIVRDSERWGSDIRLEVSKTGLRVGSN